MRSTALFGVSQKGAIPFNKKKGAMGTVAGRRNFLFLLIFF
jgi:hypothetical protein